MPGTSILWRVTSVLLPSSVLLAALFAALAPEPYMDEPFHVPQTQHYCRGHWHEWNPKITTFPGLYFFGAMLGHAVHAAQQLLSLHQLGLAVMPLCSTTVLRATNLLFAAACLPLFYAIARQLDSSRSEQQLALMAAACYLFPLHFFYIFLYYTDVPSLFFTLACYQASLQRRYRVAAGLGAVAILMRQTNAVWVAFTLAAAVLDRCSLGSNGSGSKGSGGSGTAAGRHASSSADRCKSSSSSSSSSSSGDSSRGLPADLAQLLRQAWVLRWRLAAELWPLAAVVATFAVFVVLNGGVVVGDKAHHAPVRHLAQPLYCLLYCTAWLAPVSWTPSALAASGRELLGAVSRRPLGMTAALAAAVAVACGAVARGTLAHPFLLADNRHFTFYLWRRLLNRTRWARYAITPAYLYSGWALWRKMAHRGSLWVLLLAGATCVVLVPAHLIEFRYYSTTFFLAFLHMRIPTPRTLAAIIAIFVAANVATLYLYLARSFTWPDGSIARFMW